MPKGIPITVRQNNKPKIKCSSAIGNPVTSSQIIFNSKEPAPPPYRTLLPKGKKLRDANLKHCFPTGIPIIVTHQRHPRRHQHNPLIAPPNKNHIKLPRQLINLPPIIWHEVGPIQIPPVLLLHPPACVHH